MSKIVILGGTGFVGRALVNRLVAEGHAVDVLSRNRERQRDLLIYPQVRVVSTDVYDTKQLQRALNGADAVINLVGILNAPGASGRGYERAHVQLTEKLIEACASAGVHRLVQMSALNAGKGESHYLRTRGQAEAVVQASTLDWTLIRPSVIFGPGDGLYCRFAALLTIAPVLPLARAHARFAPVWVGDVSNAIVQSLNRAEAVGRTYELGGPQVCTLKEICEYTAHTLGLRRLIIPIPDFVARLQGLAFDYLPVPFKAFSTDNYRSLLIDSVPESDGLADLGIQPTPIELVVPRYLGESKQRMLDDYRAEASR